MQCCPSKFRSFSHLRTLVEQKSLFLYFDMNSLCLECYPRMPGKNRGREVKEKLENVYTISLEFVHLVFKRGRSIWVVNFIGVRFFSG